MGYVSSRQSSAQTALHCATFLCCRLASTMLAQIRPEESAHANRGSTSSRSIPRSAAPARQAPTAQWESSVSLAPLVQSHRLIRSPALAQQACMTQGVWLKAYQLACVGRERPSPAHLCSARRAARIHSTMQSSIANLHLPPPHVHCVSKGHSLAAVLVDVHSAHLERIAYPNLLRAARAALQAPTPQMLRMSPALPAASVANTA